VKDSELLVVREAIYTTSNCISGSDLEMLIKLVSIGILDPYLYIFLNIQDVNILAIALEGLIYLLEQGEYFKKIQGENMFGKLFADKGGVDLLEKLQFHSNANIHNSVLDILIKFFNAQPIN
jgi:hypothetical protein